MKKIQVTFVFLLFISGVQAQQYFQLTNFSQNLGYFNPAVFGMERAIDVSVGYRNQWVGADGAPETMMVQFCSGTQKEEKDSLGNLRVVGKSGWGINAFKDAWGGISRNQLNLQYAYHLPVSTGTFLSFGASLGFGTMSFGNEATLERKNDLAFSNLSSSVFPDLNLGGLLYSEKYFVGASLVQAISSKIDFGVNSEAKNSKLANHVYLTAGYKHKVNDRITLAPALLVKNISGVSVSYDINLKVIVQDQFSAGLAYRNQESLAILLGIRLLNQFQVSYSYDMINSEISKQASNSHEIRLAYRFKKSGILAPVWMW
jgi:type IX secretion system PorP/SprF family membrane protein